MRYSFAASLVTVSFTSLIVLFFDSSSLISLFISSSTFFVSGVDCSILMIFTCIFH